MTADRLIATESRQCQSVPVCRYSIKIKTCSLSDTTVEFSELMMMIRLQQRASSTSTENPLLKEIDSASPYTPSSPPMMMINNGNNGANSRRRRYVHVVYPGIGLTILLLLIGKCVIDGINLQHSVCQKISGPFLINRSLSREGISLPTLDHRRNPPYSSIDKYSGKYDNRKFKILNFFHIIPIVGRTDECLVSQVSYNVSEIDVSIGFRITQIHSSAIACANAQQIGNPKYQM